MTNLKTGEKACPDCGEAVVCGAARGETSCWCAGLPALLPRPGETGDACYCRRCLEKKLSALTLPSRA